MDEAGREERLVLRADEQLHSASATHVAQAFMSLLDADGPEAATKALGAFSEALCDYVGDLDAAAASRTAHEADAIAHAASAQALHADQGSQREAIAQRKAEHAEALKRRAHKVRCEQLAKLVNALPTTEALKARMDTAGARVAAAKKEVATVQRQASTRVRQLRLLVRALYDMQSELREEGEEKTMLDELHADQQGGGIVAARGAEEAAGSGTAAAPLVAEEQAGGSSNGLGGSSAGDEGEASAAGSNAGLGGGEHAGQERESGESQAGEGDGGDGDSDDNDGGEEEEEEEEEEEGEVV